MGDTLKAKKSKKSKKSKKNKGYKYWEEAMRTISKSELVMLIDLLMHHAERNHDFETSQELSVASKIVNSALKKYDIDSFTY